MSDRGTSQEREKVLFPGYGDRVGSGVELAPTSWRGGEVVTDAETVKKVLNTIKPKRFFYSPIGDGVVAADGVEMKRGPPDLTPRVTVIQQRTVEKGPPGQAGKTVIEKVWTSGGGGGVGGDSSILSSGQFGGGGGGPPDAGRSSRATTVPSPLDSLADSLRDLGAPTGGGPDAGGGGGYKAPSPPQQQPAYSPAPVQRAPPPLAAATPKPDPYSSLSSNRSSLYDSRVKSPSNGYGDYGRGPDSGRTSTTSALFSEPGMRYEIKKEYKVTNPRELIHQYATTTPVQTIPGYESLPGGGTITETQTIKQSYSSTVEEFGPFPPYGATGGNVVNPKKFVRQLRDETMTHSQRQANLNTQSLNPKDQSYHHRIDDIRRQGNHTSPNQEVDSLTSRLLTGLQSGQTYH